MVGVHNTTLCDESLSLTEDRWVVSLRGTSVVSSTNKILTDDRSVVSLRGTVVSSTNKILTDDRSVVSLRGTVVSSTNKIDHHKITKLAESGGIIYTAITPPLKRK